MGCEAWIAGATKCLTARNEPVYTNTMENQTMLAPTEEAVLRSLRSLGDNSDKIAESLSKINIRGSVGDHSSCPVAKYMKMVFCGRVDIGRFFAKVGDITVPIPDAVSCFIDGFDYGEFPFLYEE